MRTPTAPIAALLAALLATPPPIAEEPARLKGAEKVQVDLVLVDVVVRDRKDRPVSGLTRSDFRLLIDRLPVPGTDIESFEEICSDPVPAMTTAPRPVAQTPPPAPPPEEPAAAPARHVVVFLDFAHMTLTGRSLALRSARDDLARNLRPGDRVMILAYKNSLRLVQDFTSDGTLLAARIEELIGDQTTLDSEVLEESQNLVDIARKSCDPKFGACTSREGLASTYATLEQARARRSLRALESLLPALAGIRGRKAVVLFTDVLRMEPGAHYFALARSSPDREGITLSNDILRLTREANAAGVSIYTVHASGLDDTLIEQFRDARPENTKLEVEGPSSLAVGGTPASPSESFEAARTGLDSALALQTTLAAETGGRALHRTNALGSVLETARQDLSCYYLIGYRHPSRGDNARHSILVELASGASGESRRGVTLRYRPYFTDQSPQERRERLVRSALDAPDLYRTFPVSIEAFALAPEKGRRRILIKASAPLSELSLLPAGSDLLEGHITVRGEVSARAEKDPICTFTHDFRIQLPRDAAGADTLIFETGCLLEPGTYDLAVAILDPPTREVGAKRSVLAVEKGVEPEGGWVGEVHLWTREPGAVVVTKGIESIGLTRAVAGQAFTPRSERRLRKDSEAVLSFLLCPPRSTWPTADRPIRVHRTLLGDGDAEVADFEDLTISDPPDDDTGCYHIFNTIPPNTLGDGLYKFTIRLNGPSLGAPISREAGLAVN